MLFLYETTMIGDIMVILKLQQLFNSDADVSVIFASKCDITTKSITNFSGTGRKNNLICILEEGERYYQLPNGENFVLYKNDLIFIPVTSCYTSRSDPGHTVWSYVDFDLRINGEDIYLDEPFFIHHDAEEFIPIMQAMAAPGAGALAVKGMLFTLLANMIECMRTKDMTERGFSTIYEVVKKIERNPEQNFSVHELAGLCYLSDTGFREKFKRFTGGIAPVEYRNRLRIDRADSMLKSENFTLETIAEQLGFWDAAHFCRVYKSFHGHAPRHLHEKTSNER